MTLKINFSKKKKILKFSNSRLIKQTKKNLLTVWFTNLINLNKKKDSKSF